MHETFSRVHSSEHPEDVRVPTNRWGYHGEEMKSSEEESGEGLGCVAFLVWYMSEEDTKTNINTDGPIPKKYSNKLGCYGPDIRIHIM
jgi:hypothetical protein